MHNNAYKACMNVKEAEARARIMKALASPIRLMIVDALSRGDRCVCELQPLFAIDPSTLSRHLTALKQVGIVTERRAGVKVYHHLETPCILNVFACAMDVLRAQAKRQTALATAGAD